ncbi:hypothetical protein CBL_02960 [Carabus blaptoides fortunei]
MGFLDAHLGIRQSRGSTFETTDSPVEEPSYSAEGEDACSATEHSEEVFTECTEVFDDDEEVFSPVGSTVAGESCSSAAHSVTPTTRKRRQPVQGSEPGGSTASACLQDISAAMQTYVSSKASTVAPETDVAYATYVHARLAKIKNERRKQRVKHAMDALLFTALEEEADEEEQRK